MDVDRSLRKSLAGSVCTAFMQIPNKSQGWDVLLGLTQDQDSDVRMYAYHSLGKASVFKASEAKDEISLKRELEAAVTFFQKSWVTFYQESFEERNGSVP